MKDLRIIHRDKHGRFAKANPRRSLILEVYRAGTLLEKRTGRFSRKAEGVIVTRAIRSAEAIKVEKLVEYPHVPGSETITRCADGIFKVTIRSGKTRTTLRLRRGDDKKWHTIAKRSARL